MDALPESPLTQETEQLVKALKEAVAIELRIHKQLGRSIVIGDDQGHPVILSADQIPEEACAPLPPQKERSGS